MCEPAFKVGGFIGSGNYRIILFPFSLSLYQATVGYDHCQVFLSDFLPFFSRAFFRSDPIYFTLKRKKGMET
jgi:hypothetical protein